MKRLFAAISLGLLLGCCVPRSAEAQQSSNQLPIRSPRSLPPKQHKVAEGDATSISRDGRFLAYMDDTDNVNVRDLKMGVSRRLTNAAPGLEAADMPAISNDGKQVAYQWWTQKNGLEEVRIVGLDGSEPRVLYHNAGFPANDPQDWSPDGKHVLTTLFRKDGTVQVVLIPTIGDSVRVLKALDWRSRWPRKMRFSPDGRYIAYDYFNHPGIFVLSTDGAREFPLDEHPAHDVLLGWTPDGKEVLFASDRRGNWDIWGGRVMDGKPKGSPKLVKSDVGPMMRGVGVPRDGSCYYGVSTWVNDVYVSRLAPATGRLGVAKKQLSHVSFDSRIEWSPDGKYLAYSRGAGWESDPFVLVVRSPRTGEERRLRLAQIHRFGIRPFQPHWSPDGRELVVSATNYQGHQGLYRIDARTGQIRPIVQNEWECDRGCMLWPVWSPDGTVIFGRRTGGETNGPRSIIKRDLKSGQERQLYDVAPPVSVSRLAVSPDGQWLAFVSSDEKKNITTLSVMSSEAEDPHALIWEREPNLISGLAWMPDSRHIIYAVSTVGQKPEFSLWRISAGGGEPQNLGLVMEGLEPYGLSVHPDGKRIAFTAGTAKRDEVWVLKDFLPGPKVPKD